MPDAVAPRPRVSVRGAALGLAALAVPFFVGSVTSHGGYRATEATGPSTLETAWVATCAHLGVPPERFAAAALLLATAASAAAFAPVLRRGITGLCALLIGAALTGTWVLPIDRGAAPAMFATALVATATACARASLGAPSRVIPAFAAAMAAPLFDPIGFLAAAPVAAALAMVPSASNETVLRRSAPLFLWGLASPILVFAPATVGLIVAIRGGAPVDAPADWLARLCLADLDATFMEGGFRWWAWAAINAALLFGLRRVSRLGETPSRIAAAAALFVVAPLPWMVLPTGYAADAPYLPGAFTAFPGLVMLVATLLDRGHFALGSKDQDRTRTIEAVAGLALIVAIFLHTPAPRRAEWNLRTFVDGAAKAAAGATRVRLVIDPDVAAGLPERFLRLVADAADRPIDSLATTPTVALPSPIGDDLRLVFVNRPPQIPITRPFDGALPFPCSMPMTDADVAGAWMAASSAPPIPAPTTPWAGRLQSVVGTEELVSPAFSAQQGDRFGIVLEFARNEVATPGGRVTLVRDDGLADASAPLDYVGVIAKAGVVAPEDGTYRLKVRPAGSASTFTLAKLSLNAKRRGP